eukprot:scaffold3354_cov63-Phaeocystis_antarctica.AAC.5
MPSWFMAAVAAEPGRCRLAPMSMLYKRRARWLGRQTAAVLGAQRSVGRGVEGRSLARRVLRSCPARKRDRNRPAPYEPGEVTTRVPSVAYGLDRETRIAAHAQKVQFGVPETLLQSWDAAPDTSARTSRHRSGAPAVAGAAPHLPPGAAPRTR